MPRQLSVGMPDGTKFGITVPDDASNETIQDSVNALHSHWDAKNKEVAASALVAGGAPGGPVGDSGIGSLLSGAVRGVSRGMAGIGQAELSALNAIGIKPFGVSSTDVPAAQKRVEEALPAAPGVSGEVGTTLGEMAPLMVVPGGPIVQGIVGGATSLTEKKGGDELVERLLGGAIGGTLGTVLGGIGKLTGKFVNIQGIENQLKEAVKVFGEVDPAKAPMRRQLNQTVARLQDRYTALGKEALTEGDKVGSLNVKDLADNVSGLVTDAQRASGQNPGAMKLLKDTERLLTEPVNMPETQVVGGAKFKRDPLTGEYKNDAGDVLPDRIVKAFTPADAGPPDVRYSHLRAMRDNLDEFLKKNEGSNNDAVQKVRDMRKAIDTRIGEATGPEVKALEKKAQQFHDKNLGKYDNDTVRDILGAKDDLERANIILEKVVKGKDTKLAGDVADMLSKDGREAVSQAVGHDALVAAKDLKTGKIDPLKFTAYFEGKPQLEPFKIDKFDDIVKGFGKYIKESAAKQGESTQPTISRGIAHGLSLASVAPGLFHFLTSGDPSHIMRTIALGGSVEGASALWNKMVTDTWGRHLLVAASKVPEGSPRWQRLVAQLNSRFAGPAAGEMGQAASQSQFLQ